MAQKNLQTIEDLKAYRIELLQKYIECKTSVMKNNLHYRLKTVNKALYKRTKETKWL